MRASQESLPHCCGVDDIGNFAERNSTYPNWSHDSTIHNYEHIDRPGTGLFTATFVNNKANREAYEECCKEHKLLYQSPVKRNRNSNNRLFLCVFEYVNPSRRRGEREGEKLPS